MAVILANETAWPGLKSGIDRIDECGLDIIEAMIRDIEAASEVHSVGRGSWPNMVGELELDASIMYGRTLEAGAVAALKGYLHPISVARAVMSRLPHVFLAGEGAARFAREIGAEASNLLTEASRNGFDAWVEGNIPEKLRERWPECSLVEHAWASLDPEEVGGTTCVLVCDDFGDCSAGVSTSGWAWKYPGRVGDSPVIGAGCYADNRYGAVGCIGTGEMAIRVSTARSVILYMKQGMCVEEACREAARDYRDLSGGVIRRVVIHAVDRSGSHFVLAAGADEGTRYYVVEEESGRFEERISETMRL